MQGERHLLRKEDDLAILHIVVEIIVLMVLDHLLGVNKHVSLPGGLYVGRVEFEYFVLVDDFLGFQEGCQLVSPFVDDLA